MSNGSFKTWGDQVKFWHDKMIAAFQKSVDDGSSYEFSSFDAGYTAGVQDGAKPWRGPAIPLYDAETPPVGLFALRDVIRCLRETGSYADDEGEATNALEDLLDRISPAPQAEATETLKKVGQALADWSGECAGDLANHLERIIAAPAAPVAPQAGAAVPIAPWSDALGQTIRHGDRLSHPDGTEFVAVRLNGFTDKGDAWRAIYDDASVSRLSLQIGDKGRAFLVAAPQQPAALSAAPAEGVRMRGSQIKANWFHDAGAYARCSYCKRYSDDPATLSDWQPTCDCGEKHGWSGSFVPPTAESQWSGTIPATGMAEPGAQES